MQSLRETIRGSLARCLRTLGEEDRLAAALPVVCGTALAAHCEVQRLDEGRTLHLEVDDPEWISSLVGMRELLLHDLQRVAGVPLSGLHFAYADSARDGSLRTPSSERAQAAPRSPGSGRRSNATAPTRRTA